MLTSFDYVKTSQHPICKCSSSLSVTDRKGCRTVAKGAIVATTKICKTKRTIWRITVKGKRLILALTMLVLAASTFARKKNQPKATAMPRPAWVDNASGVYPPESYIVHVGQGATKDEAQLAAVTGVAAVFSQDVRSTTRASKRMSEAAQSGKVAQTSVDSSISRDVQSGVDAENLIGVQIAGFWEDGKGCFWAIAVLDKKKASGIYQQMIRKNAQEIAHLVDIDTRDADYYSFETYARYDFAREVAGQNEALLSRLQVIDLNAARQFEGSFPSSRSLRGEAAGVARMIPVYVEVSGDETGRLKAALEGVFSSAGFRTSDIKMERYVLKASAHFTRRDTDSSVQCSYSVEGGLVDANMGETLVPLSISGREASTDFANAKNRAMRSIEAKVQNDFAASFAVFLDNHAAY